LLKECKVGRRSEGIEYAEMQPVSLTGNDGNFAAAVLFVIY